MVDSDRVLRAKCANQAIKVLRALGREHPFNEYEVLAIAESIYRVMNPKATYGAMHEAAAAAVAAGELICLR